MIPQGFHQIMRGWEQELAEDVEKRRAWKASVKASSRHLGGMSVAGSAAAGSFSASAAAAANGVAAAVAAAGDNLL